MWTIKDRGFLPAQDPIQFLPPEFAALEGLVSHLPELVSNKSVRGEMVKQLGEMSIDFELLRTIPELAERAMVIFSYFASSYIHCPGEPPANVLPKEIAIPLMKISKMVGRPPILSYASYCLYNWTRLDRSKPVELGNIKLLQNFTLVEGRRDENWFVLVHVDIEDKASQAISAIERFNVATLADNLILKTEITSLLEEINTGLSQMCATLDRMPEECSADVYYGQVRPYIFSYVNVVYEGCDTIPMTYRGETGAQSSCIPAIQTALGVKHRDSMLTAHRKDMRNYMPPAHRNWLADLEIRSVTFRDYAKDFGLHDLYNQCLAGLIRFRKTHLGYAIDYIQKKVANPTGTGGTPYVKWLSQLVDETEEFML
jgi:indoleamine 2,3-dioxygenase